MKKHLWYLRRIQLTEYSGRVLSTQKLNAFYEKSWMTLFDQKLNIYFALQMRNGLLRIDLILTRLSYIKLAFEYIFHLYNG